MIHNRLIAAVRTLSSTCWEQVGGGVDRGRSITVLRTLVVVSLLLLAGCDGLNVTSTETPTDTPTPTATPTETATPTPTPTATPTREPSELSQFEKWDSFTADYYAVLEDREVVRKPGAHLTDNGTIRFVYTMQDPENSTQVRREQAAVLTTYTVVADEYMASDTVMSKEWVPPKLEVTAVEPESEEVYFVGETNFTTMNKYRTDDISYSNYYVQYVNSLENGPGHPDYEKEEEKQ